MNHFRTVPRCFLILIFAFLSNFSIASDPVAEDDAFQAVESIPILLDVIANDYDLDGTPLLVNLVNPSSATCWGITLENLIINNGDGSLIFKTPNNISGSCTFDYRITSGGTSVTAQVTINVTKLDTLLPEITEQPTHFTVAQGESASFSVQAGPGTLDYLWMKDGIALSNDERISGAESKGLFISDVTIDDIGVYECVVSNEYGEVTSERAHLILITDQVAQAPFGGQPVTIPAQIEAEQYDFGGSGVSHFDTSSGNGGNVFRTGDIDIGTTDEFSYFLDNINAGEWVEYSIFLPSEGNVYDVAFRYATTTPGNGRILLEVPTLGISHSIDLPSGPEGEWTTHQVLGLPLGTGERALRISFIDPNFQFDSFEIGQGLEPVAVRVTDSDLLDVGNIYDLGPTIAGQAKQKTFTIHNDHPSRDLVISNVNITGNGLSIPQPPPSIIEPMGRADFQVELFSAVPLDASGILSFSTSIASPDGFSTEIRGQVNSNLTDMVVELSTSDDGLSWQRVGNGQTFFLNADEDVKGFRIRNEFAQGSETPLDVRVDRDSDDFRFFFGTSYVLDNPLTFTVPATPTAKLFAVGIPSLNPDQDYYETRVVVTGNASQSPISFKLKKWIFPNGELSIEDPKPTLVGIAGGGAKARVHVSGGSGSYIYRWQKDIRGQVCCTYEDIDQNTPNHVGYNSPELEITQLAVDARSDVYKVIVYDEAAYNPNDPDGSFHKSVDRIVLTVYEPLVVTSEPAPQHVSIGGTAQYEVYAEGGDGLYAYEWQYRPRGGAWSVLDIDSNQYIQSDLVGGSRLQVVGVSDADVGEYRCLVTQSSYPENEIYSLPAYLSTLRFSSHPQDAFSLSSVTFSASAQAGGLPITYRWLGQTSRSEAGPLPLSVYPDHADFYAGINTQTLTHYDPRFGFAYFSCQVSDGYTTLNSLAAGFHATSIGEVASDGFWHGNGRPARLSGLSLPFGGLRWRADSHLRQHTGKAYLPQGAPSQGLATVPWRVRTNGTHRVEIQFDFPAGSSPDNKVDFGFFVGNQPDFWARQFANGNFEIYTGNNALLSSGNHPVSNSSRYILEINEIDRTFSLSSGNQPLANSLPLPGDYLGEFSRAGFRLERSDSQEIGISEFRLRTLGHYQVVDDIVYMDRSITPVLTLNPLSNDLGDFLNISNNPILGAEHGTATHGENNYLIYTPDVGFTGWDEFYYEVHSPSGFTGVGQVKVFVHDGQNLHAEPDSKVVLAEQTNRIDILSNDLHLGIEPTITNLPSNGSVTLSEDGFIHYTPHLGFLGTDALTYTIQDHDENQQSAVVTLRVVPRTKGLVGDSFNRQVNQLDNKPLTGPVAHGSQDWIIEDGDVSNGIWRKGYGNLELSGRTTGQSPSVWIPLHTPGHARLGTVFNDDFESGDTSIWPYTHNPESWIEVAHDPSRNDLGSLQFNLPGGSQAESFVRHNFSDPSPNVLSSFTMITKDLVMPPGDNFKILKLQNLGETLAWLNYRHNPTPALSVVLVNPGQTATFSGWVDLTPGQDQYRVEFEWWSGSQTRGYGGSRLRVDGDLLSELTSENNDRLLCERVKLGITQSLDPGTSGRLVFDDYGALAVGAFELRHSVSFTEEGSFAPSQRFGWAVNTDQGFDHNRQTSLFAQLSPGSVSLWQQNRTNHPNFPLLGSAQIPEGLGERLDARLTLSPETREVTLWINGRAVVGPVSVDPNLEIESLDHVGFYFEEVADGNVVVHDFALSNVSSPVIVEPDAVAVASDEIATISILANDFVGNHAMVALQDAPKDAMAEITIDRRLMVNPSSETSSSLSYRVDDSYNRHAAPVSISVQPALGPDPASYLSYSKDDFEFGNLAELVVTHGPGQVQTSTTQPLRGKKDLRFDVPELAQSGTYVSKHFPSATHWRGRFVLNTDGLQMAYGDTFQMVRAKGIGGWLFNLYFRERIDVGREVRFSAYRGDGERANSVWAGLSGEENVIDLEWWASHPWATNGGMRIGVDGQWVSEVLNLDNASDRLQVLDVGAVALIDPGTNGSIKMDDVSFWLGSHDLSFRDGFESGDGSAWTAVAGDTNKLSFTDVDAIAGQSMVVTLDGTTTGGVFTRDFFTPTNHFIGGFKLKTQNVVMSGHNHRIVDVKDPNSANITIYYRHDPQPSLLFRGGKNSGGVMTTDWVTISGENEVSDVVFEWWADPIRPTGGMRVWIDGVLRDSIQGIDNQGQVVDRLHLGVTGSLETTSLGSFFFDDYHSWTRREEHPAQAVEGLAVLDLTTQTLHRRPTLVDEGSLESQSFTGPTMQTNWLVLQGDWDADNLDGIAYFDPENNQFHLVNDLQTGVIDTSFQFGSAGNGWLPLAGDWNGDGMDSVGLYSPTSRTFYLQNNHIGGVAELTIKFGLKGSKFLPVAGDWNGDGVDTIGTYDPHRGLFHLAESNTNHAPQPIRFGEANRGYLPVIGDWDGDGIDSVGLFDEESGQFILRFGRANNTSSWITTISATGTTLLPLSGQWGGQ